MKSFFVPLQRNYMQVYRLEYAMSWLCKHIVYARVKLIKIQLNAF